LFAGGRRGSLDHLSGVRGGNAAGACALSLPGLWVARLLLRRAVLSD
jgi:hypothetical protein